MNLAKENIVIKAAKIDNVGVVVSPAGLQKGTILDNGIQLEEYVPMGHKVALSNIGRGE